MIETMKHRATVAQAKDTSTFSEGGILGMLERAKGQVEALAYFAAPELGADAALVRDLLTMTIEGAISQVRQDDAFIDDLVKAKAA
ncbi:hypothetical protein ASG63_16350 [Methylobacterium sp. Leaf94]|uniref:hypothetical protein n=1 Tax=Methylobacterium sp. Leaf94 TaxID=1736250 RepID=UPI000700BF61|nr:hypothetical protein [Methylobacterium sp. Leaf94]KQU31069.1 hypothetical protein ASG63_16350 [Methylobacterium sp. Leaf94]